MFDNDREQVLDRARQAGLVRVLNPGIDFSTSLQVIDLADTYPEVYAAIGVHPNEALSWKPPTLKSFKELAKHPKVVAIGEIGLDYFRDRAPKDVQQRIFQEQLELAAEVNLPVIIHTRNASPSDRQASEDVLRLLDKWQTQLVYNAPELAERPGVLHSFSDNLQTAMQATVLKFWIGFTGPVTFRKVEELHSVVTGLPIDRLLVETDAPFLTPHPNRGQRNEPAYVRFIVNKIAQIREQSWELVAEVTTANAERLFNWQARV